MRCFYGKGYKWLVSLSVHTVSRPYHVTATHCKGGWEIWFSHRTSSSHWETILSQSIAAVSFKLFLFNSVWVIFIHSRGFQNYLAKFLRIISVDLKVQYLLTLCPLLDPWSEALSVFPQNWNSFHLSHYPIHIVSPAYNCVFYIW